MEFCKGYKLEDGTILLEGESVRFTVVLSGETLEGTLVKAAVKEAQIEVGEVVRVEKLDSITNVVKM